MLMRIIVKDRTNISLLYRAIKNFETQLNTSILNFYVGEDHFYTLVEFDGISARKWRGNIDEFIKGVDVSRMELVDMP